jgi:hypothetical protein
MKVSQNVPVHILLVPLSRHERRLPGKLFRRVVIRYETRLLYLYYNITTFDGPRNFLTDPSESGNDAEILQQGGGLSHYSNTVSMH